MSIPIAVIDHGAGNLVSIAQGLAMVGADVTVAAEPSEIGDAAGIVLPGVGSTGAAMQRLGESGFVEPLREWDSPLLGICVGLQLFFERSDEDGAACLGLLPGEVRRLRDAPRLPHIGWNDVALLRPDPLFDGIGSGEPFYFVHSYAPAPADTSAVLATASHGGDFVAAVRAGQRVGVQFHPERSAGAGLAVLSNFVAECGEARRAA